jgi:hypothetical protein
VTAEPPWKLYCWCGFSIHVSARGGRGRDQGAGVEAYELMMEHLKEEHPTKTWKDYLDWAKMVPDPIM